jgi:hypothetical protein
LESWNFKWSLIRLKRAQFVLFSFCSNSFWMSLYRH